MVEVIDARLDDRPFRATFGGLCAEVGARRWVLLWRSGDQWLRLGAAGVRDGLLAALADAGPGSLDCMATVDLDPVGQRLSAAGLETVSALTLDPDRPAVVFFEHPQRPFAERPDSSAWFSAALDAASESAGAVGLMAWAPDLVALSAGELSLPEALSGLADAFGLTGAIFATAAPRGISVVRHHGSSGPSALAGSSPAVLEGADWSAAASHPESAFAWLSPDRPRAAWSEAATTADGASLLAVEGPAAPLASLGLIADLLGQAVQQRRSAERGGERIRLAERTRLATTLHEELSQQLASMTVELDLLASRPRAQAVVDDLAAFRGGVVDALESLRSAIFELTPPEPDWTQLEAGLARFVADHAAARGLRVDYEVRGEARPIDAEAVSLVFATVQEALSNVAKHSGTFEARVEVVFAPESVDVTVADRGIGFAPSEIGADRAHQGLGLLHTRARLVGASLEVDTESAAGTVVRLGVPARQEAEVV